MASPNDASQAAAGLIRTRFQLLMPKLSAEAIEKLVVFKTEIIKQNPTLHLVPPSLVHVDTTYFADSYLAGNLLFGQKLPDGAIYDFGNGGGFPALVLAAMQPEREVIILEKDPRRLNFIKHVCELAKVKNARAQPGTIEELPEKSIKIGITRSTLVLSKLMLTSRRPVAFGGYVFYIKGDNWPQELAGVPSQLFTHWEATLLGNYRVPESETDVSIISTKKISD